MCTKVTRLPGILPRTAMKIMSTLAWRKLFNLFEMMNTEKIINRDQRLQVKLWPYL